MISVGIVGSRQFSRLDLVERYISILPADTVVISGGARGVDTAAASAARVRGLRVVEYLPDIKKCRTKIDFADAYYARNRKIAEASDVLVAFTDKNSGGTWNTIKHARSLKLRVEVIRSDEKFIYQRAIFGSIPARTGGGPYLVSRVNGYAIHRCRSMDPVVWADFVNAKDTDPELAGSTIADTFVRFLQGREEHAGLTLLSMPPRSLRNMGKPHPVSIALERVAARLGLPWETPFVPWEKPRRGNGVEAIAAELCGTANVTGERVLLLDDVITTGNTLVAARFALLAAGAADVASLAYVVM